TGRGNVLAGLGQRLVAGGSECVTTAGGVARPFVEIVGRGGNGLEMHVGEAFAADISAGTLVGAGLAGHEVQLSAHAAHSVYLAAELRNPERVHRRVGRDLEIN